MSECCLFGTERKISKYFQSIEILIQKINNNSVIVPKFSVKENLNNNLKQLYLYIVEIN